MQPASESLIAELELAVKESPESRIKTLRRVTDLFLNDADRLNDDQIKVFDDVLCLLIRRIEAKSLVELSKRLAPPAEPGWFGGIVFAVVLFWIVGSIFSVSMAMSACAPAGHASKILDAPPGGGGLTTQKMLAAAPLRPAIVGVSLEGRKQTR